ncbi:uncharacterized protein HaLaN_08199, partial [Haematococcus lacustris]
YAGLSAVEIQTDRYAKFRKLGRFQEWVAVGVHTKAGTWAASEAEAHFIEQVRSKAISTRGGLISLGAGGAWSVDADERWEELLQQNREWTNRPTQPPGLGRSGKDTAHHPAAQQGHCYHDLTRCD